MNGTPFVGQYRRYVPELKKMVVETMREERLSDKEADRRFNLPHTRAAAWKRINFIDRLPPAMPGVSIMLYRAG